MKLNSKKSSCRGIAMTEYLIILTLVAIAAIGVTTLFGGQLKGIINDNKEILKKEVKPSSGALTQFKRP